MDINEAMRWRCGRVVPEWFGEALIVQTCGWWMSLLVAAEHAVQLRRVGGGGGRCSGSWHLEKLSALIDAREESSSVDELPAYKGFDSLLFVI